MKISIIIPVYNEEENLQELYKEIKNVCDNLNGDYEVIFIDDGSRDKSFEILKELALREHNIKIVRFKRNFGQTAAISAGINLSIGEIIIPMDADLQNDPRDILKLLEKINQGFDVVSGWRKKRKDKLLSRKLPSRLANVLISFITGVKLHDYGCTIKAYRREIIKNIRLYGEMHRFIPAFTVWNGAKITEMEVNHMPRKYGKTKYGILRTFRVVLDLLTVKFLTNYLTKPMHFFGWIGFWSLFFSVTTGFLALFLKIFKSISFISTPLPLLIVFLILVGFQFILMGLLAEILIRIYYESTDKDIYSIKEKINFD